MAGEVAAEPLHLASRSFSQLEWTPLYTGVASPLNARLLPTHQSRLPLPRLPFSRRPSVRRQQAPLRQPCIANYEASCLGRRILEPPKGAAACRPT